MPKHNDFRILLIGRGIPSDLAIRIAGLTNNWKDLAKLNTNSETFSHSEQLQISAALKRKQIPLDVIKRLVTECDWKCCLCWHIDSSSSVIIHHIDRHSRTYDDSFNNLVLLCPNHHAQVHSTWEISRSPFPPELLKVRKAEWIKAVAEFKKGLRTGPGREQLKSSGIHSNIPTSAQKFVGRQDLINTISSALTNPEKNKIAITGMGGVGKTAFSLKVANENESKFLGGVFWTNLAADSGDILPTLRSWLVATGCSNAQSVDQSQLVPILRKHLTDRMENEGNLLFVLDDVREIWINSLQVLMQVIPANASILLSTRDATVPVSVNFSSYKLGPLDKKEAIELLHQESCSCIIETTFKISSIVELLGYLPLAIVLVAKQVLLRHKNPNFSLEFIYSKLLSFSEEVLHFPGHQGLVASFLLSYESLDDPARRVFRWLGAFSYGPIKKSNIEQVVHISSDLATSFLERMVHISVLEWHNDPDSYTIHPLLYQYSKYTLAITIKGEERRAFSSHMQYYSRLIAYISEEGHKNNCRIQEEFSNINRALYISWKSRKLKIFSDIVFALWVKTDFLTLWGYDRKALSLLKKAAVAQRRMKNSRMEAAHTANLGAAFMRLGEFNKAERYLKIAIKKCADEYDLAANWHNLGILYRDTGKLDSAAEAFELALEKAESAKNIEVVSQVLCSLGSLRRVVGDLNGALSYYKKYLEASILLNNDFGKGNALSNIGLIYLDMLQLDEAEKHLKNGLAIAQRIGDKRGEANRTGHLGTVFFNRAIAPGGEGIKIELLNSALQYFHRALDLVQEINDRMNQATWTGNLANCFRCLKMEDKAMCSYLKAYNISKEIGHKEGELIWAYNLGNYQVEQKNVQQGRIYLSIAYDISVLLESPRQSIIKRQIESIED